jgi:hypothetical protein
MRLKSLVKQMGEITFGAGNPRATMPEGLAKLMDVNPVYRPMFPGNLHVPVRVCGQGIVTIRIARLPAGERVGLGFTSLEKLTALLGTEQGWIIVNSDFLHDMLAFQGISKIQVDPDIVGAPSRREKYQLLSCAGPNVAAYRDMIDAM